MAKSGLSVKQTVKAKKLLTLIDEFLTQIIEVVAPLRHLNDRILPLKMEQDRLEPKVEEQEKQEEKNRSSLKRLRGLEKPCKSEEKKQLDKVYAKLSKYWKRQSDLAMPSHNTFVGIIRSPLQPKDLLPPGMSDSDCDKLLFQWLATKKNLQSALSDDKKIAIAHSLCMGGYHSLIING
jgi:predicted nuclease with TOPRIM domain